MARKYDWGDGNGAIHTIPLSRHLQDVNYNNPNAPNLGQIAAAGGLQQALAQPAAAPAAAPTPGSAPRGAAPFVPDAQYLAEAALRAKGRQDQIDTYNQQSTQDARGRDETIRRLLDKVPDDTNTLNTSANKQGLFYSGQLTKQLSDYNKNLERAQGDARTEFQNREDARDLARKAIASGASLEEAAALAAAAGRQVGVDTAAADNNALVANAAAPAAGAPGAPAPSGGGKVNSRTGAAYTVQPGAGGSWHVYQDGRRVWVPKPR